MSRPTATRPPDPDPGQPEDDDAGTGHSARLGQHVIDVAGAVFSTSTKPRLSASASTLRRWPVTNAMTISDAMFVRLVRASRPLGDPRPEEGPGGAR